MLPLESNGSQGNGTNTIHNKAALNFFNSFCRQTACRETKNKKSMEKQEATRRSRVSPLHELALPVAGKNIKPNVFAQLPSSLIEKLVLYMSKVILPCIFIRAILLIYLELWDSTLFTTTNILNLAARNPTNLIH